MIGQNIKRLRLENHMTQKELADRLFVTAQAVSRWENSEVEPSLKTLAELAKIFGVSTDEILGVAEENDDLFEEKSSEEQEERAEDESFEDKKHYEERPQILALCEKCNNPIYNVSDIVRFRDEKTGAKAIRCKTCDQIIKKALAEQARRRAEEEKNKKIKRAKNALTKNIILAVCFVVIGILCIPVQGFISVISALVPLFCFFGCIIFRNTFFGRMLYEILFWHDPSDMDLGMLNLLLWLFDLLILVVSALVAFSVGLLVAPFLYPFAVIRNRKKPEKTMLSDFWESDT